MIEAHDARDKRSLRQLLTLEHKRLDQLFEALLAALHADARDDAARLWGEFDAGLSAHMQLEEQHLFPVLSEAYPEEAAELRKEHDAIRTQLTQLGIGVDLHLTRAETVSAFVELLRKHARREDALAYQWAERELSAPSRVGGRHGLRELLESARGRARPGRGSKDHRIPNV
jgi:hemerythrin-like domain-containing protein